MAAVYGRAPDSAGDFPDLLVQLLGPIAGTRWVEPIRHDGVGPRHYFAYRPERTEQPIFSPDQPMLPAVAIVAGSTGLVGQAIVRDLAGDPTWREVRALTRRPPTPPHVTAVVPVQVDYAHLEPPPTWAQADHVFCALGTTMRQAGSREAFRRVDLEYPLALARAAHVQGARHFLLVSAVGASATSRVFYNRVKGEIEDAITAIGFRSVTIARPSLLVGPRAEHRLGERIGAVVGLLAPGRWRPVEAKRVARALVNAAKEDLPGVRILENPMLRATPVPSIGHPAPRTTPLGVRPRH